ncbi:MAG: hypothetical protein FJ116_10755 [Deltaproteobacteria bacterium]|nr:hypothetical protein [Deltaproteobacteria bacterium]
MLLIRTELFASDGTAFSIPAHQIYTLARYEWFNQKGTITTLVNIEGNARVWSFAIHEILSLLECPDVDLKGHFHPVEDTRLNRMQAIRNAKNNVISSERYMALWHLYSNPANKR